MKKRSLPILFALCIALILMAGLAPQAEADDTHVGLGALTYKVNTKDKTVTITDCDEGARGALDIPSTIEGYPVVALGNKAFRYCNQITSVTIPNTVTSIGEYAFDDCTGITGVVIPDSVTKIGMSAFSDCPNLISITFGNGLTELNAYMCQNDVALTTVKLPDKLTKMGINTFNGCSSLTSITLPNTLKSIGSDAFNKTSLTSITLPNSVEELGSMVFYKLQSLKTVNLGTGLKSIGSGCFLGDTSLESLVIPDSVTTIKGYAFEDCTGLKTVVVGGGLKDLGWRLFSGCTALETVTIRSGVQSINSSNDSSGPFRNCSSLETLYLPGSLVSIGRYTFRESTQLKDVYFNGTAYEWGGMAIGLDNDPLYNAAMHYVPFQDTNAGDWYYESMLWAIDKGVTRGTTETTFGPNDDCTQAHILTFLYRAVKSPSVNSGNSYTNSAVTPDKYYYTPMQWAYQQGIVTNSSLDPESLCTRADVVTYLWRLADKPGGGSISFTDVSPSADYAQAVAWAVRNGITAGTTATTFSPANICTRAQIVTFLYRALA